MQRFLASVLLAAVAACGATEDPEPIGYGDGLGTPENPIPQDGVTYSVRSRIEPVDQTLPAAVTAISQPLHAFATSPAHTLLAIAQASNVPALATLKSSLSSTLSSQLEGWIDIEIDKAQLNGKTLRQFAGELAGYAETTLTRFGLDSMLSFSPTKTTHTLAGISFRLSGLDVIIPLGGLKADVIGQNPPVTVGAAGAISFGDHQFGIALGDHAWHGVNLASANVFGSDVQTAMVAAMNCRDLAQKVAARCSGTSCVGHATELTAICENSVDLLVGQLEEQITGFDVDVLRYTSGTAHLVDENGDGLANKIENGVWQPEMSVGRMRATFTALANGR